MPCRSINGVKCFLLHSGSVSLFPEMRVFLNELCHAINCHIYRRLKLNSASTEFQNNGPVLLFCRNRFLLSVATDSEDGNGMKLDNDGPTDLFQILMLS